MAVTLQQTWHKVIGVHKWAAAFQLSHLHTVCLLRCSLITPTNSAGSVMCCASCNNVPHSNHTLLIFETVQMTTEVLKNLHGVKAGILPALHVLHNLFMLVYSYTGLERLDMHVNPAACLPSFRHSTWLFAPPKQPRWDWIIGHQHSAHKKAASCPARPLDRTASFSAAAPVTTDKLVWLSDAIMRGDGARTTREFDRISSRFFLLMMRAAW